MDKVVYFNGGHTSGKYRCGMVDVIWDKIGDIIKTYLMTPSGHTIELDGEDLKEEIRRAIYEQETYGRVAV